MKRRIVAVVVALVCLSLFIRIAFSQEAPASKPAGAASKPAEAKNTWLATGAEKPAKADEASQTATGEQPAAKDNTEDLAKAAQNPIANLISVPFQSNFNFFNVNKKIAGQDYDKRAMGYLLNVQPVIPFSLSKDWNLITRTIIPVINQPEVVPGLGSHGGLGDIQFTGFFSPTNTGKFTLGAGPVLQFPSATDEWLGTQKWTAGPSVVAVYMDGPWVVGGLFQNVWSYAGDPDRNYVNQMLIQPFVNYNLPKGWYLTTSPIITADWHAQVDQRWTVPVGGGIGRLMRFGKLPVNLQLQSFYNVVHPDFGPEWSVRFQIQFLFPK